MTSKVVEEDPIEEYTNDPTLVKVYGPGVRTGVRVGNPVQFTIDCTKSGPGDVSVDVTDANRNPVLFSIIDNNDDTFTVTYEAQVAGLQSIVISLDDIEVPLSPITFDIKPIPPPPAPPAPPEPEISELALEMADIMKKRKDQMEKIVSEKLHMINCDPEKHSEKIHDLWDDIQTLAILEDDKDKRKSRCAIASLKLHIGERKSAKLTNIVDSIAKRDIRPENM